MSNNLLVLQSDFGLVDGAVSAMIGVALSRIKRSCCYNLTHYITPYNIFEGSYRLFQTVEYWPEGTTFVSVVDPGVGSKRKSVVALTNKNQYIVTPDNGTLSFIKKDVGIKLLGKSQKSLIVVRIPSILIRSMDEMFMLIRVQN
jgi:S-adenosylmethionine hydrolase